ncbi:hypothetical protein MVEN_01287000 [Mycena venus]|uniref:Uncharacterized protein n=1 Tax=Mycena venus TaxID=2733690 RepID=A0A8H6Y162_9AGAR|nr:hypothetical protein MVEN_01287000 [Mycena venus]
MSSAATFCDMPISAIFDGNATSSSISLDWVMNSGLRTANSRVSGRLTLPSDTGNICMSMDNLPVDASPLSDLVLGMDWFCFARNSAPGLVVRLASGPLALLDSPTLGSDSEPSALTCFFTSSIDLPIIGTSYARD